MKYSRQDYLNKKCTHREYYAQFVTDSVIDTVKNCIGLNTILNSKDKYLNDINLSNWDRLHAIIPGAKCLADTVCIAKEAAKQIKENNQ